MMQEAIRTPVWFAAFWVEASADPNAEGGVVAIAGAPPKILANLNLNTPLPLGTPGARTGDQGVATGATLVANNRGLIFQTLPIWYPRAPSEGDLDGSPSAPQLPSGQGVISVSLLSLDGRYHPRIANLKPPTLLTPPGAPPFYVALRPSLQATRISESGALVINLKWSSAPPIPASWAVVTLTCTRTGVNYGFTGQADVNGDVIVPLTGLPPLPQPTSPADMMNVIVQADINQSGVAQGCDTDALLALSATPITVAGSSTVVSSLPIKRGQITKAGFTLQAP